eukprot:13517893-Ditylum_brightwellii.AAC.1
MRKFNVCYLLRALLLDLPLSLLFLFFLLTLSARHIHDNYLILLQDAVSFQHTHRPHTEHVYYERICDKDDVSTSNLQDLLIDENWTSKEAAENIHMHGLSMFPSLISRDTAAALR